MKISIITVTFNSATTIKDTLECIASQNHPSIEHIIIDGGSTDETVNIASNFPHVAKIVSEKDEGLYHAMNKGLQMATGDVIGILNSDDVYASNNILSNVVAMFEKSNASTLYGDLLYVKPYNLNSVVRYWKSGEFKRSNFYYGWMPPHPSFFVRREVYDKVGLFSTALKSAADYEMMLRILVKNNFSTVYLPEVLVKMRAGGVSNMSLKNRLNANMEDRRAWKLNDIDPYFFTLYMKPLRKVIQFIKK